MPRLPRIHIEGTLYYVTCRGAHEQQLFEERKDYLMYIELLTKYRKEYEFKLFGYVLLSRHLHLLIEPTERATISEIMHVLNSSYSKYFNSEHQRKGHLFRERFKTCLVEKGPYLARLTAHIHRNPLRVGEVEEIEAYPYSSLSLYTGESAGFEQEVGEVKGYLGQESYLDYIKRVAAQESQELHKNLQRKGLLGSKEFVQRIRELVKQEQERKEPPSVKRMFLLGALVSALLIVGVISLIGYMGRRRQIAAIGKVAAGVVIRDIQDLESTEWQIIVTSLDADKTYTDTLSFVGGKFSSNFFSMRGFTPTNFSVGKEDATVIWETLQTRDESFASWHGEIKDNKMQGIMSLRLPSGEMQDFSFISIEYRRK